MVSRCIYEQGEASFRGVFTLRADNSEIYDLETISFQTVNRSINNKNRQPELE